MARLTAKRVNRALKKRTLSFVFRSRTLADAAASHCRRHPAWAGTEWLSRELPSRVIRPELAAASFGHGRTVLCDLTVPYDRFVYAGWEERAERRLLERLLAPGDVFVDVGANIGLHTVVGAAAVGPTGRVIALEPVPSTFARLEASVAASDVTDRVRLLRAAGSDRSGATVTLSGDSHNMMRVDPAASAGAIEAPTIALDDALRDVPRVAGMKVDVEGHELAVLTGAEETIRRSDPWILIEFNTDFAGTSTLADWDVHRHLTERGYAARPPRAAVDHGSVPPLDGTWSAGSGYVNLVYWRGSAPR